MNRNLLDGIQKTAKILNEHISILLRESPSTRWLELISDTYSEIKELEIRLHRYTRLRRSPYTRKILKRLNSHYQIANRVFRKGSSPRKLDTVLYQIRDDLRLLTDVYGDPTTEAPPPKNDD